MQVMEDSTRKGLVGVLAIFVDYEIRETVPSLTSDMGKKTVSVKAHFCLLPQ